MNDDSLILRVVAAVIERGGMFLICQRADHKQQGGLWEFPGGKLEGDESLFEAVRRELEEELKVRVTDCGPVLFETLDTTLKYSINFASVTIEGEPSIIEHQQICWVPKERLLTYELAPADRKFVFHYFRAS